MAGDFPGKFENGDAETNMLEQIPRVAPDGERSYPKRANPAVASTNGWENKEDPSNWGESDSDVDRLLTHLLPVAFGIPHEDHRQSCGRCFVCLRICDVALLHENTNVNLPRKQSRDVISSIYAINI